MLSVVLAKKQNNIIILLLYHKQICISLVFFSFSFVFLFAPILFLISLFEIADGGKAVARAEEVAVTPHIIDAVDGWPKLVILDPGQRVHSFVAGVRAIPITH